MISINKRNKMSKYRNYKIKDIYGFVLENGFCFINTENNHIASFWFNMGCEVDDFPNDINSECTFGMLIDNTNICRFENIVAVFTSSNDFELSLNY